jgi:hypothetical protein
MQKYVFQSLFKHFTAGETVNSLKHKINELHRQNVYPIVYYIRESTNNNHDINNSILHYIKLSDVPKIDYIAIKLSSLGFHEDKIDYLIDTLINKDIKVMIDAEDVNNHDKINEITDSLVYKYNKKEINVYKTYQMYRKDGLSKLHYDIEHVNKLGIKLVRGAYYNQDYNSGKLFTTKYQTDFAFENAMKLILKSTGTHSFICTHNYRDINQLIEWEKKANISNKISHASLYGFINNDTKRIINAGISTYKYLPYGNFNDSIPYLTRRIYENPKILLYLLK